MYSNYNPYYTQPRVPQQQVPPMLMGKQVDSIDVVRATDVPFDGSVSYFPLTDGSAIVTKQLQMDGTSKITIFKPTVEPVKEQINYLTIDDLDEIKEEVQEIRRELKDLKKKGDTR